jgi:hypothetical protein
MIFHWQAACNEFDGCGHDTQNIPAAARIQLEMM